MSDVSSTTQPLRDLARRKMREEGWTLVDVSANAHGARSKSWFGQRFKEESRDRPLKGEEIQAIADGLRLRPAQVRAADLAGLGLRDDRRDPDNAAAIDAQVDVLDAIRRDPHLLPEARAHLQNQYELLLRLQQLDPTLLATQEQRRAAADLHAAAEIEESERSLSELAEVDTEREVRPVSPNEPTPIHGKRQSGPLR